MHSLKSKVAEDMCMQHNGYIVQSNSIPLRSAQSSLTATWMHVHMIHDIHSPDSVSLQRTWIFTAFFNQLEKKLTIQKKVCFFFFFLSLLLLLEKKELMNVESFLLFSQDIPSANLGFIDSRATTVDISILGEDYTVHQSPTLLSSSRARGTTGAGMYEY